MKEELCKDCKVMIEEGWYFSSNPGSILSGGDDMIKHFCGECGFVLEIKDD